VEARLEAEVLLGHVLGVDRAGLYARLHDRLPSDALDSYQGLLDRRLAGEPVAYISGRRDFYGLSFQVDRRVLIPRPETELLVERALALAAGVLPQGEAGSSPGPGLRPLRIADVGCGSGCVAVALAVRLPAARIAALDLSAGALDVTRANAQRHGVGDRVTVLRSDLLARLPGPVDLVVANLPYVRSGDLPGLPDGIYQYEPLLALDGGPDGLDLVRRLLDQVRRRAARHIPPPHAVLLEIGAGQGEAVVAAARHCFPAARVALYPDLAGLDRVLQVLLT
jgi:release factor glutamine methyltransferase